MKRAVALVSVLGVAVLLLSLTPALGIVPGGSTDPDDALAFVATSPCAVFDSRSADPAGRLAGGSITTYQVAGAVPSSQINDGAGPDCMAPPEGVRAVELNLVAIGPLGGGNLKVAESGVAAGGGVVNYAASAGSNNSNAVDVEVDGSGRIDVEVVGSDVHVRGVVLGYWITGTDVYESFDRTIVVGGSGTPTENGAALLEALSAISTEGPTAVDPWEVRLQPGMFDTGGDDVNVPSHVDLVGAGRDASTIDCGCGSGVSLSSDSTLAHLSVNGSNPAITAIGATDVMVTSVATDGGQVLIAFGSVAELDRLDLLGELLVLGSSAEITDSTLTAVADGVTALTVADAVVRGDNLRIDALDGTGATVSGAGTLELADSSVIARGPTPAVEVIDDSIARLDDVRIDGAVDDGISVDGGELVARVLRVDANGEALIASDARVEISDGVLGRQSGAGAALDVTSSVVLIDDGEIFSLGGGGVIADGGDLRLRDTIVSGASGFDGVNAINAGVTISGGEIRGAGSGSAVSVTDGGTTLQHALLAGGDPALRITGDEAFVRADGGRIESFDEGVDGILITDPLGGGTPFAEFHHTVIGGNDDAISLAGAASVVVFGANIVGPDTFGDGLVQGDPGAAFLAYGAHIDGTVDSDLTASCTGVTAPSGFFPGTACP